MFNNPGNPHNPMMDAKGRVWFTHQIRGPENPDWCREGSDNPFGKHYPRERAPRHVAYFDPETEEVELIDTCFNTHHLQFGSDDDDMLYLNSVNKVIGCGLTHGSTTRQAMPNRRKGGVPPSWTRTGTARSPTGSG